MYAKESAHGATRDSVGVVNHQPEKIALVVCCSCIFHPRSSINPGIQRTDFRSASTMNSGESERVINIFRCIFNFIETYLIFTKFSLERRRGFRGTVRRNTCCRTPPHYLVRHEDSRLFDGLLGPLKCEEGSPRISGDDSAPRLCNGNVRQP